MRRQRKGAEEVQQGFMIVGGIAIAAFAIFFFIDKALPSLNSHGPSQAFFQAQLIRSDLELLERADSGEISRAFGIPWDIEVYREKSCLFPLDEDCGLFVRVSRNQVSSEDDDVVRLLGAPGVKPGKVTDAKQLVIRKSADGNIVLEKGKDPDQQELLFNIDKPAEKQQT